MTLEKFGSPVMKKMILRIQFSFLFCLHTYFILCFSLFLAYVQKKDPGQWLKKKRKTKGSFENVWRNAFDWNKTWLLWAKLLIYFTDFFFLSKNWWTMRIIYISIIRSIEFNYIETLLRNLFHFCLFLCICLFTDEEKNNENNYTLIG